MQVKVEDVNSVKKIIHVEIPAERVSGDVEARYKELKKSVSLKGFRKGRTPRSVLERLYKKDVDADIINNLLQESLPKAISESGLEPIEFPQLDPPELDYKGAYKYSFEVEAYPEIGELNIKGFKLQKTIYPVNDNEVEVQLKMLQQRMARFEKISEERAGLLI